MGGPEPPQRAARRPRPAGLQERLRAGRMRLVLGLPRRHARVLLPRARRPGRRPQRDHGRGDRRRRRPPCRPAGDGRRRRRPVRLLHARLRRGEPRPAGPEPAPERARDPRGAGRQPVPLHGLREDHRRGQARRRSVRHERPDASPARRPAPRPDRRDHHADRRRARRSGASSSTRATCTSTGCCGARRSEVRIPARISGRSIRARRSRCRACAPCSPTTTCPAARPTGWRSPTSPCWPGRRSATRARRSRSSPPTIPRPRAAP